MALLRRTFNAVAVVMLLSAACGSEPTDQPTTVTPHDPVAATTPSSSTTAPAVPTATTSAPATTTVPVTPTVVSTTPPSHGLDLTQPVLVASHEGVFQLATDGTVTQLVAGPVAYAVDDARGGLLYQVHRGRDWEAFFGNPTPGRSTVVWWVPKGESSPRELLVPTRSEGHDLTLHDTVPTGGSFAVVYQRHEGTEPPFDGDMQDTLRVYDTATGGVTQLHSVRGWEWNLEEVTAGNGLVAATERQILGSGCRLFDTTGLPAVRPGVPTASDTCFDEGTSCATKCALSSDGTSTVYMDEAASYNLPVPIAVANVVSGRQTASFTIDRSDDWWLMELDVVGEQVLANRGDSVSRAIAAMLLNPDDPDGAAVELPIAGVARFASAEVAIDGPVRPASIAGALTLRPDGLGAVSFGDSAGDVMRVLESLLGPPTDQVEVPPFGYRDVAWEPLGFTARFDDDFYRRDGGEHFAGWFYASTGTPMFSTAAGATVGHTLDQLRAAHRTEVVETGYDEACRIGWYAVIKPSGTPGRIVALLGGTPEAPGMVQSLEAGAGTGC